MPAGNNGGGNLNLFMFELGMITRDPLGIAPDLVTTIAVHPLVVIPNSIQYTDSSLSSVQKTPTGGTLTKAGRANLQVQFTGTFGVESRGLGIYLGTGENRFQRFWHEIVRLGDALNKEQVDREKDPFRSPFLSLALLPYDEERCHFFVNFYDFWHGVEFECHIPSFGFGKTARGGGAAGMTFYRMSAVEAGPIVSGGIGTTLIQGLFDALRTWDTLNETIKSYTLDAIVGALVDGGGVVVGEFADTINAVNAQIDGVTGLTNGFTTPLAPLQSRTLPAGGLSPSATATPAAGSSAEVQRLTDTPANGETMLLPVLDAAARLAAQAVDLAATVAVQLPTAPADPLIAGAVDWSHLGDTGGFAAADAADAIDGLYDLASAAAFQSAAGAFYGMGREEFAAFVSASGGSGRTPAMGGSISYTVGPFDSALTLEHRFGVPFDDILRLNDLLPYEAFAIGRKLQIPQRKQNRQPSPIRGLPTFGSHTGQSAWGSDVYTDLRVDGDGGLAVNLGTEFLVQGIDWLLADAQASLLKLANEAPPVVQKQTVRTRIAALLLSDRRIAAVSRVDVVQNDSATGLSIVVEGEAINGGTINTGRSP